MNFLLQLLLKACIETISFTGIIILIGLFLGILRNYSIRNFQRSLGSKSIMLTGVIGVPVHELSHAVAALVFRHNIMSIKLFQRPDAYGVMGYVEHSYNQNSIYQQVGNFFIGVAPILGGIGSMIALMYILIPETYESFIHIMGRNIHLETLDKSAIAIILNSYWKLVKAIFSIDNFQNPYFYIFLFVSICICSHIALSSADIKGASSGLGIIFLVFLILNALGIAKYIDTFNIIKYNIVITSLLIVSVIFSLITFFISLVLLTIRKWV
jgi:hypothetical protein